LAIRALDGEVPQQIISVNERLTGRLIRSVEKGLARDA